MLSAVDIQRIKERINSLDDEALIEETRQLRASAEGVPPKLAARWDELIGEAVGQLTSILTIGRIGRRKEARGRLRGFCIERHKALGQE